MTLTTAILSCAAGITVGILTGICVERDRHRTDRHVIDNTTAAAYMAVKRANEATAVIRELTRQLGQRDQHIAEMTNTIGGPNGVFVSRRDSIRMAHYQEQYEAAMAELDTIRGNR